MVIMTLDETQAEIDELGVAGIAPGLVAVALRLARHLDDCEAPTSAAVVARELRATMLELRKVAPAKTAAADPVDQLAAKRKRRRSA